MVEAGVESGYKVGDEVITFFSNETAREQVVIGAHQAIRKPSRLNHFEAAALWVGWATAFNGLIQRGNLKRGEVCLITGAAGGMGTIALELAKERGAIVVCTVSSEAKRRVCQKLGADAVVILEDSNKDNWAKDLKQALSPYGGACDVCYEIVGGALFQACTRVMNANGRLLVIGFAGGSIGSVKSNLPLIKGYSVVGVRSGAQMTLQPELRDEAILALEQSKIRPLVDVFPAKSGGIKAFQKLSDRKAEGKIVLDFSGGSNKL